MKLPDKGSSHVTLAEPAVCPTWIATSASNNPELPSALGPTSLAELTGALLALCVQSQGDTEIAAEDLALHMLRRSLSDCWQSLGFWKSQAVLLAAGPRGGGKSGVALRLDAVRS